jgi:hypothetical protein
MKRLIGITGVTAAMMLTTGVATASAYSHSSTRVSSDTYNRQYTGAYGSSGQCYNGGWQNIKASDGSRRFASQQQCLDYYNRSNVTTDRATINSSDNFRSMLSDFLRQLRSWIDSLIQQLLY